MSVRFLLLIAAIASQKIVIAQKLELDSLYTVLNTSLKEDSVNVKTLLRICWLEYTSHPEKNKEYASEALKISKQIKFDKGEAGALRFLALYQWGKGNHDVALSYSYEAIRIFEKISDYKGMGLCYQTLASIHRDRLDFEKAKEFLGKSLEMFITINDKQNMAYTYNGLGVLYLTYSRLDEALENFKKSAAIRKELNDKEGLTQSYVNLAIVYTNQKKYKEALAFFTQNISLLEESDNKYRMAVNYDGLGHLYTLTGDFDKAKECLMKAIELGKILGYKKTLEIAYSKLTFLEKTRGQFKDALTYHELEAVYRDSLYQEEKTKQIAEIETQYETEKKDQEIELLKRDKQIQALLRNIFISASILLILFLVSVYFVQRLRAKKNQDILNLKIDSITSKHNELSEKYKSVLTSRNEENIVSHDQRLLKKAIEVIENNISDTQFGVEKMSQEIGMSRNSLHRKIKAITGFPPSELIRNIRLRKAALLLQNEADSVSQISFAVGFEEHSYFSKSFKKQFGVTPSEYAQSVKTD